MPRKLRELRLDLRRAGFVLARQKGSHQTWQYPSPEVDDVVLSGADGDDAKPYQERDVRQGINVLRAQEKEQP